MAGFNNYTKIYEPSEVPDDCPDCGSPKFVAVTDHRFKPPAQYVCQNCNFT